MVDETIIIDKLEDIKNKSKIVIKNKYIDQKNLEYLLDGIIKFIEEKVETI